MLKILTIICANQEFIKTSLVICIIKLNVYLIHHIGLKVVNKHGFYDNGKSVHKKVYTIVKAIS